MDKRYIRKILLGLRYHEKNLFTSIESKISLLLTDQSIELILNLYNEISSLGIVNKKYKYQLLLLTILGVANHKIKMISICSDALTSDPNVLREKKQYKKINYLQSKISEIAVKHFIDIDYFCILPDINPKYIGENYYKSWINNRQKIEQEGKVKCYLLKDIVGKKYDDILNNLEDYVDFNDFNKKINYYKNNLFIVLGFNAVEDFQEQQIKAYTVTGILLEKYFPNCILVDIQKQNFPFEQNFYNYSRINKLPIIFSGQEF